MRMFDSRCEIRSSKVAKSVIKIRKMGRRDLAFVGMKCVAMKSK